MIFKRKLFLIFCIMILPLVSSADRVLQIKHKSFEYYKIGQSYLRNNQNKKAIEFFDKAIDLTPNSILLYNEKGVALDHLKKYHEALRVYNKALKIKKGKISTENWHKFSLRVYVNKAVTLVNMERYEDAIEICDKGLEIKQEPYLYNTKGAAFAALRKYDQSIENYNKAIELDPKYFEPYSNKFCPLYNLKRFEEAVAICDSAIALEPDRHNIYEVHANKALVLVKLGRNEEAIESANAALKLNPKSRTAIEVKEEAESFLKAK